MKARLASLLPHCGRNSQNLPLQEARLNSDWISSLQTYHIIIFLGNETMRTSMLKIPPSLTSVTKCL